jgi:hypothetical protein
VIFVRHLAPYCRHLGQVVSNAGSASEVTSLGGRFIVRLLSRLIDLNCSMSASA